MISDVHLVSRTGAADYYTKPPHSDASREAFNHSLHIDPHRNEPHFAIIKSGAGLHIAAHYKTTRKDGVGRTITNTLVLKAKNVETALHLYDARHSLLEWAENSWHDRPGGNQDDLMAILKGTKATTTEEDLATWNSRRLTKTEKGPEQIGFGGLLKKALGIKAPDVETAVGTIYYKKQ